MKARDALHRAFGRSGKSRYVGALGAKLLVASVAILIALVLPAAVSAAPPTLTINAPSEIESTKAHISGTVDPDGIFSEWWFETSTDGGASWSTSNVSGNAAGTDPEVAAGTLKGLRANQLQLVRLTARNFEDFVEAHSAAISFETDPAPVAATATLDPAEDVEYTTAKIQGAVDPEKGNKEASGATVPIHWILQLSKSGDPGTFNEVTSGDFTDAAAESDTPIDVPADPFELTGLTPGHTYTYRLLVTYGGQPVEPIPTDTFTTKAVAAPLVSNLDNAGFHLTGMVNPNAPEETSALSDAAKTVYETTWSFICKPDCGFSGDNGGVLEADNEAAEVSADVDPDSLIPNQSYDVFLRATNVGGEDSETKVGAFKTAAVKPTIDRATLFELKRNSVELRSALDTQNAPLTDCYYRYGSESLTEHEVPCEDVDELQLVNVRASAGQFRVNFAGEKTPDIDFDATAATVQAALEALPSIGPGAVLVVGGPGGVNSGGESSPFGITFIGSLGGQDVQQLIGEDGTVPLSGSALFEIRRQGGSALERTNGSVKITALTPATEYHFQLVASNSAGTTEGEVRTFTTPAVPTPETCPNQAIRDLQRANHLVNCAAWEKVSPADKNHGDIIGDGQTNIASKAGDAVTMSARTAFGDVLGSGVTGQTQYLARRGPGGWATRAITPAPRFDDRQLVFGGTRFQVFSEDLRRAVLLGYDLPAATDDIPQRVNIYLEDTDTRALVSVTAMRAGLPDPLPAQRPLDYAQWGVSADARHVTFVSAAPYLPVIKQMREEKVNPPEPPEQGPFTPNVYQWDDGILSLAGILPDGTVPVQGSDVRANLGRKIYRDAMSDDGSRQLFVSPPEGSSQLYQRIDGIRTAWISEPEGSDSSTPEEVQLRAVTPDGRNVFFTTESALLDEDESPGPTLYRWTDTPDPAHEDNLTLITHACPPGGGVCQILGVSDDGERVYYKDSINDLLLWDHGSSRLIASSVQGEGGKGEAGTGGGGDLDVTTLSVPNVARLSPDGRYVAFLTATNSALLGATGTLVEGRRKEMYLYDRENDALNCLSCPSGSSSSEFGAKIVPTVTSGTPEYSIPGIRPRFLTANGSVLFSSPEALVPEDTNGVFDAYRYDAPTGELSLVSSGTSPDPTSFVDASASGGDVFLVTREQLVPSDSDDLADVYDARAGGGFDEPIEPPHAPCSGERCQGSAGQAPPPSSPASQAQGRGNVVPKKPFCRRPPKHKKHGAAASGKKHRCKHKHRGHKTKHGQRAANANGRTAK